MNNPKYPLHQIVMIKKRRLEEAERFLKQKKEELIKEEEKLVKVKEERDLTLKHFEEKHDQLKSVQSQPALADEIESIKLYIKTVQVELEEKQEKVKNQQAEVAKAEEAVKAARANMLKKQQEVEKLRLHEKSWKQEIRLEELRKEGIETDDLGTTSFSQKKHSR